MPRRKKGALPEGAVGFRADQPRVKVQGAEIISSAQTEGRRENLQLVNRELHCEYLGSVDFHMGRGGPSRPPSFTQAPAREGSRFSFIFKFLAKPSAPIPYRNPKLIVLPSDLCASVTCSGGTPKMVDAVSR